MKNIGTILTLCALVGLGYFGLAKYVEVANGQTSTLTQTDVATGGSASGAQVIALLQRLKAIHLDDSVFSDPGFTSLQDFSTEITPEAIGRQNPFTAPGYVDGNYNPIKTTPTKTQR